MILWLLVIGVISILGQVVLLRELNVAFYGSELIYILALGVWLLWTASGAAVGRRTFLPSERHVQWLLIVLVGALPLAVVFVRGVRRLFGAVPGAYLPFPSQLLAMCLALLPVGLLLGLLFQWAAKLYVDKRRTLAAAYAIESLGGVIGGVLATLFLKWGVQNLVAALVCGLLAAGAVILPRPQQLRRLPGIVALAGGGVLILGLLFAAELDQRLTGWNHPQLAASRDTPYGRVTVTETSGQLALFVNDALAFESEGTAAEEFVHLAALQCAAPESVMVLGGALEGLLHEIAKHRPVRLDYVELNADLLDLLAGLPLEIGLDFRDGDTGHVLTVADPRRFLISARGYDLILVGMPEPASGQDNRYYTREFFAQCAHSLAPAGVLAFQLRGAENLWTPQQTRRAGSIHRALREIFSAVVVLPGATNIFLASSSPLPADPAVLAERLAERQIDTRLVSASYLTYLYTNDRFTETADLLRAARAPANTDARPICYQYTLLLWLARFFPVVGWFEWPASLGTGFWRQPWTWPAVIIVVVTLLLVRHSGRGRRAALVGIAGSVGMILETALILNYQVRSGVLYQDLGLLLTLFMAGLALGAAAMATLMPRGGAASGRNRQWGAVLWLVFLLLSVIAARLLTEGAVGSLITTGVLLVACGFLVAGIFAHVSLHADSDQRLVISPLYAADLIGGCLGSVLATLFLIPVFGLAGAALSAAALSVIALILL